MAINWEATLQSNCSVLLGIEQFFDIGTLEIKFCPKDFYLYSSFHRCWPFSIIFCISTIDDVQEGRWNLLIDGCDRAAVYR